MFLLLTLKSLTAEPHGSLVGCEHLVVGHHLYGLGNVVYALGRYLLHGHFFAEAVQIHTIIR